MATYLSNKCIGLDNNGYGALLSEVTFTCSRLSAEWAAMSTPEMSFTVVPLNRLPSELKEGATADDIEIEKQRIRDEIISKSNAEIVRGDAHRPLDQKAMVCTLLARMMTSTLLTGVDVTACARLRPQHQCFRFELEILRRHVERRC